MGAFSTIHSLLSSMALALEQTRGPCYRPAVQPLHPRGPVPVIFVAFFEPAQIIPSTPSGADAQ